MNTGERIRQCREKVGLTQDQLAEKVGFTDRSSVSKIESGQRDVTRKKLVEFANALNVSPLYLLGTDPTYISEAYEQADAETQSAVRALLGVK